MRITTIVIYLSLFTLAASISSCQKDNTNNWVHAYINIPFEMIPTQPAYLYDTILDTITNHEIRNRIEVKIISIEDYRVFGESCSFSTASGAVIKAELTINDTLVSDCNLTMPGCTNGQDLFVSSGSGKCEIGDYILYILNLSPQNNSSPNLSEYSVKYIVKHK